MRSDYERDRIKISLDALRRESDQLTHNVMRVKRDEQFEIERLHREFKQRIEGMETRKSIIASEIRQKEAELKRLEDRMKAENPNPPSSAADDAKARRLNPHL